MSAREKVNILLVDDQPAKLLSYEVILKDLNENLVKTQSAREALEFLLKSDVAVILVDVVMPDLDGFQLASMIRDHPRFQKTAIIFISAVQVTDVDRLRGYEIGAVDYVPVPVVPEVLRAKVRIFVDLYRKTRELERLNRELEQRVSERTAELQAAAIRLQQSDKRRTLALAAGKMGSWDWDLLSNECTWDDGQYRICGLDPEAHRPGPDRLEAMIHPDDRQMWHDALTAATADDSAATIEFRLLRPSGEVRWCIGAATATRNSAGKPVHITGVTVDITERKEAEQRQALLAREVDHRSRNALAVVQSILRLSKADHIKSFLEAVEGRIQALAIAHGLLSESRWEGADFARIIDQELKAFRTPSNFIETQGPNVLLRPASAQGVALAIHELVTNAAKYGALSTPAGKITLQWRLEDGQLIVEWLEADGPPVTAPTSEGFGSTMIRANVEGTLDGSISFLWRPQGLNCIITMPQTNLVHGREKRALAALMAARSIEMPPDGNKIRILLVEDEALVALAMQETLHDLGYQVIGPFARNADALGIIGRERIDGAVLDLNVGGEPVYPVADALADRHIPYLLVTGYGTESIDSRYRSAPTLQKPVESQSLANLLKVMFKVYAPMRSPSAQPSAP